MNELELAVEAQEEPAPTRQPRIVLSHISKRYGPVRALTDVSLEVAAGEVHALLGENGAGKSTLMNVASGTVAPDSGTIEVDGAQFEHLTPTTAAQLGIAIVHQHPALLPDMTVAENVRVALPQVVSPAGRQSRTEIRRILDEVGFKPHLDDRVDSLSVVDKHLLELAKALAVKPAVLILDEPTAPLDQESVEMLFAHVRRVAEGGSAVIYITHRLAEVRVVADRVTILRDGEVRGVSSVEAISDDELLRADHRAPPRIGLPPEAGRVDDRRRRPGDQRPRGRRLHRHLAVGRARRDRRRRRHRRQRPERAAARPRRPGALHRHGDDRRHPVQRRRPAGEVGVHAAGPPHRGADDEPDGARERRRLGAATVHPRPVRQPQAGGRARHPRAELAEHPDTRTRGADLGAVRRQPAEGRDGPLAALRSRRSSSPTSRPRASTSGRGRRSTASCATVSASGVPVVVASSDALELQGLCDRVIVVSRGHCVAELAGDDVTEEQIVNAAMRAERTSAGDERRADTAVVDGGEPLHPRRLRAGRRPRPADDRPRRLHLGQERPLPLGVQHDVGDAAVHGARLHRHRPDDRRAARRHRPVRRTARRDCSWSSARSSSTTAAPDR